MFRARDVRLGREVAVKVVPELFATDPDRIARFAREAQVLASLNHPNIAAIYGFEESDSVKALVLELVEGPTLADRLAEGPIPLDESLSIAKQLVDALEAAHERGIIHRDLKPANIKQRPDGTVKVLDFGLAKALDPTTSPNVDATNSPTLTARATQLGIILGTAAYMAPEQARGKAVDKRADIWAFGCVLYEMLTGRRAFEGEDISDTLAFVITKEPDWTAIPASVPSPVRRLLRRCLEKDRKRRLADIADARLEIEEAPVSSADPGAASTESARPAGLWRILPWAVAGILVVAVAAMLAIWAPWRREPPQAPLRLSAELGADLTLRTGVGFSPAMALSPDGTLLALTGAATASARTLLFVRRLDQLSATPLVGTEDAAGPFFSPDGRWIAFFADGRLKKIPAVTGGPVVTLADAPDPRGGSWAEDDTIVFTPGRLSASILRGPSPDSPSVPWTAAEDIQSDDVLQRWPQVLPGDRAVLYTSHSAPGDFDTASIVVRPLSGGARKVVLRSGYYGRYVRSGHLLYIREGTLFAVPFDLERLEVSGPAAPVVEEVISSTLSGAAQFAVSNEGTLTYLPGKGVGSRPPILWMGADGKTAPLRSMTSVWESLDISPDGRRLVVDMHDGKQWNIWIYEWARDTLSRLTFDGNALNPVWTPDGRRVVFSTRRVDGSVSLFWQGADGAGEPQRLTMGTNPQRANSWHPSGRFLAFSLLNPSTQWDLVILPMEGDEASGWKPGKPTVFLSSPFIESDAMFSPDGKWVAYRSNESGRSEVYVRPFPGPGPKSQISSGGGTLPTWSPVRRELFFSTDDGQMMVAAYSVAGDAFSAQKPRLWAKGRFIPRQGQGLSSRSIDLHPDGERFAVAGIPDVENAMTHDHLGFVFNLFDELRRIAPPARR